VDQPDATAGTLYSSPPGNPFVGLPGRDEIFALGMRNPWRFSFDRTTGQQWVADVGQGELEEVDTPIVSGGNYGWRVYEGTTCTNRDPLCGQGGYIPPLFEYPHEVGRCSVTGGYSYRGEAGAIAAGTYVYGDFCSGEIFTWNGTAQSVLLDTSQHIASFGEDEQGELYVVGLFGGTVSRLESPASCTYALNPSEETVTAAGGAFSASVSTQTGCSWTAVANNTWLHVTSGASGNGSGTVGYSVDANTAVVARPGTFTIAGKTLTVNQAAAACEYSIAPTAVNATAAGGTGSVAVTAQTGCNWTAVANDAWLHVTSASGNGNGSVGYSVDANAAVVPRTGTLIIAGQTFTVTQAAAACTYSLSPTLPDGSPGAPTFPAGGGSGTVGVATQTGCGWTAVASHSWIKLARGASGSGNGTVAYTVQKLTGKTSSRPGFIAIGGKTFTITQAR
jgi:hypothetical protein